MSDVDDELLALAGGLSDDEDDASQTASRDASMSPPPPSKKQGSPKAERKAPAKKAKKKARHDDSEEEGEASSAPSSPNSLESAPMDESDSDAEPRRATARDPDSEDKYPIEGVFVSYAEKEEIMRMPELQRETILAERAQESERNRQNALLRQLVSNQENEEKKQHAKNKKRAADAELDEGQRKSTRPRTRLDGVKVGERSAGIDSLKRARAEKSDRQRRREEDRERNKDRMSPTNHLDRDLADDEDEWLNDRARSRTPEKEPTSREIPVAELRDFERIRVGRRQFAERCFDPGFEDALTGCYVRVAGDRDSSGQNKYHLALIRGFSSGRPYAMVGPGGNFVTDQYVIAAIGKSSRDIPFIFCSDSPITESELHRYKMFVQQGGGSIPKKAVLENKVRDINNFISRSLSDREVSAKVERKRELRRPFDPVVRENLRRELDEAKARGKSQDVIDQLEEEYDSLLRQRLAHGTSLRNKEEPANKAQSQQERLAAVNLANRRANQEAIRKAQIQERKHAREMEEKIARGEVVVEDHSRRLKTRAKFVFDPSDSDSNRKKPNSAAGSGASTPANGTPRLGAQKGPLLPHLAKLQEKAFAEKKGIAQIHTPLNDDDVIGAMDLDIDIEI